MKELTFKQRDEFRRQPIAEKLISLLTSNIDISPMVIDGGWGTGKTEFCHKLIDLMNNDDTHHLIYVDAFKADHADEPLLTVLAEVIKILPTENAQKDFMKKALPVAKYAMKALAKAGVAHILRQDAANIADDFDKEIQKAADTAIDTTVESTLKEHIGANKNLKALQDALIEIAGTKPIVLFIDELDRCRPDFAVNMLEIIKHTFDVKGVQFVLITNTQQLKAAINHCYGDLVNAQRYLDKFLKFTFTLPELSPSSNNLDNNVSLLHYKKLVKSSNTLKQLNLEDCATIRIIKPLINQHQISLREIETFVRYIEIYITLSDSNVLSNWLYRQLAFTGIFLATFKPQLAKCIINDTLDANELGKVFDVNGITSPKQPHSRPNQIEVLCHLLSSTAKSNNDLFKPKPEYQDQFNTDIERFMNAADFYDCNQCVGITKKAIMILAMQS